MPTEFSAAGLGRAIRDGRTTAVAAAEACLEAIATRDGSLRAFIAVDRDDALHFHCVVIDGVFDATAAGGVIFKAATGLEANAIAQVQAQVRRRLARACSCAAACCQPMTRRRWGDGNMAAASPSTPRCASRPPTAPGASGCCGTAPGHRSPSTGCASATASTSSTTPRNRAPVQVARSA